MSRQLVLRALSTLCAAGAASSALGCSGDDPVPAPIPEGPCDPETSACSLSHGFGTTSLTPGMEVDGICMSWVLDNDTELWVNTVAMENDGFFHHSNWFFVPEDEYDFGEDHWSCFENGFSELDAALKGGVLYAQSTQTTAEEQRFLPGAAIRIPPRAKIIAYTHVLNTTPEDVTTEMRVTLETVPEPEVSTKLTPFRLSYNDLKIPAMSQSEFGSDCFVKEPYEAVMKQPFFFQLHYLLPHFHTLGTSFRFEVVGGPSDGEVLFDLQDAYGEPLGIAFDTPIDLAAMDADGIRFVCGYTNPREEEVGFGIGDQEMCVMLGFADSGYLFDGTVSENVDVEVVDGKVINSGPCQVVGLPYKPNLE